MTRQKQQAPDLQDLFKSADKYLDLCMEFFKGVREKLDEVEKMATNVDSTWRAATDKVDDTPHAEGCEPTGDPFDAYMAELEKRAARLGREGEGRACAAVRQIINELREMDAADQQD